MSMAPVETQGAIDQFRCYINPDIEYFLQHCAIDFEQRGISTTYLYYDFDKRFIEGYFALTHKALPLQGLSKNKVKSLGVASSSGAAPFILLGQLGRYMEKIDDDNVVVGRVSGDDMMSDAFDIIYMANSLIMNRRILLECDKTKEDKLRKFYERHRFSVLSENEKQYTMYMKIDMDEMFADG